MKLDGTNVLWLVLTASVGLASAKWAFLPARRLHRHRVRRLRLRLLLRLHPGNGHATLVELWWRWGRLAAFRHSTKTRPGVTLTERVLSPASAYSVLVGRAHYRHALRLPLDEHVAIFSPPRGGKTGWLARVILQYPGPVLSTTTKHDVYALTASVRSRRGPLYVFNPQGVGGVASTFRWNPLDGCEDPAVAIRRADAFASSVTQAGVEDSSFWAAKASDYLRAYFHAAALAGYDLRHVARWVSGSYEGEAEAILATYPTAAGHLADQLAEMQGEANKTISTVRMTMSRALAFLADPALAAAVLPGPVESLDIPEFLARCGTLYLIAETRGEDAPVAPLFACLTNEIHYVAALSGSLTPGNRLDPPLCMALDEVTQICPVPVPSWLADSGGKGIQIVTVAHGEAQLRSRWGANGSRIILDTSGTKIWLPGISDPAALDAASALCGTTAMKETRSSSRFRRHRHHDTYARHPIMTPEMIRQLPVRHALVIRGSMSPVIARLPMAWNDPAYRQARRQRWQVGPAATAAPEPSEFPAAPKPLEPDPWPWLYDEEDDVPVPVPDDEQPASQDSTDGRPSVRTFSTGGGHRHAAGRAGTTEFPATWSAEQVMAHIISVARYPELTPVWQPNQRWRVRGARDGVEIIVLLNRDGGVITAWPLPGGRGVQQNPSWSANPDEAQLAQTMADLPARFSSRLDADDLDALRTMAQAGEWAEEADLLVAALADKQQAVTGPERLDLTHLLGQLELATNRLQQVPATDS